jgi:hypothetical protein
MANTTSVAQLVTMRDNLITAYTTLCTTGVTSYSLGDRTFSYESRSALRTEIQELDRMIAMRDTTINGRGRNRVNFKKWN